jgi:hypothetical protein
MAWLDRITARHLAMNEELRCGLPESGISEGSDGASDGWMDNLELNIDLPEREFRLYLIDELLADAVKHYPLERRHDGERREIALRSPATTCETRKLVE